MMKYKVVDRAGRIWCESNDYYLALSMAYYLAVADIAEVPRIIGNGRKK